MQPPPRFLTQPAGFCWKPWTGPGATLLLCTPSARRPRKYSLKARQDVAKCLNAAREREITFTSGGSEADNQALLSGAMLGKKKGKMHIISTAFEHHAVLHSLKRLEKEGFK